MKLGDGTQQWWGVRRMPSKYVAISLVYQLKVTEPLHWRRTDDMILMLRSASPKET